MLKESGCPLGESCDLSHDMTPERVPDCVHFAKGNCTKINCSFNHSTAPPGAPVCRAFGLYGYCGNGANCTERHVSECPDFSNTGTCKNKGCKLLHRDRASLLRARTLENDTAVDISSDDEPADSADVDSDAVAEYIEADSDESDFEPSSGFLPV